MNRIAAHTLALALALPLACTTVIAQSDPATKPAAAKPATKPAPQPATSREELKSEAKGLALATDTAEAVNDKQLAIATRVLTGKAACEYSQTVDVDAVTDQPGYFKVRYKGVSYVMVPEETTTGAIRLFDRKSGVIWLQIPVKSMLLDARAGQRMVDLCTHAEQRAAVEAVKGAARPGTGLAEPTTTTK